MSVKRKKYSASFKAQVAIEAIQENKTVAELASEHGIHPSVVQKWKLELLHSASQVFEPKTNKGQSNPEVPVNDLYEMVGKLQVQIGWLKKKSAQLGIQLNERDL
jgi:transposase-like protein